MRSISFIALALLLHASSSSQASASTSPKRGLVYTPNAKYPQDDQIWDSPSSAITWYYNYGATPSRTYLGSSNKFEFVPQLWGRPSTSSNSGQNDTGFLNSVSGQIKTGTTNITHVLGFNEPDMSSYGGSGIAPSDAAQIWMQQIEPLARLGVELGSPACSSAPSGISWMQDFLAACKNCTIDFMAVHFYGNFEGLASHVGQYVGTFNKTVWVTEFAYAHADLADSQSFFNQSISFLDRNPNVTRYSYFGAFRSDVSNVGADAAFLTQKGKLTDIGSWYIGGSETGNKPSGAPSVKLSMIAVVCMVIGACIVNVV